MASKSDSAAADAADLPQPGQYQATYTDADRQAGYILVKLGPKARYSGVNMRGDAWGVFHEFDDRHPNDPNGMGGEALVVEGKTIKVYPTAGVRRALGSSFLEEVNPQAAPIHDAPPNVVDLPSTAPANPTPPQLPVPAPDAASSAASK